MWENYPSKLQRTYPAVFSFHVKNCSFFVISPLFTVFARIQQHWRHSKGGKKNLKPETLKPGRDSRGDAGIAETRRGAFDRIETFGKGRDRPTAGWPAGRDERARTSQFTQRTADRRAFALRMGRVKIPHSTCEHDRVRLFYPPLS